MILCTQCNQQHQTEELLRHCSNCFACTNCLKYICSSCGHVIIITEVKQIRAKVSND